MKKTAMKTMFAAFAATAASAFAAVPVLDVESVTIRQGAGRTVEIEYTMNPATAGDDEPAIVTVDILTNAVGEAAASVGGEHLQTLQGDVNKIVEHTANYKHKILWSPHKEGMPKFSLPAAQVTAQLTLWATNSPPNYWIVDLDAPTRDNDRFYLYAEQIPGTVTNAMYKTSKLVMRRIPAKGVTWKMGSPDAELWSEQKALAVETQRYVSFSKDYFIAVFEATQGQVHRVDSSVGSANTMTPRASITMNNLRGTRNGASQSNWPSNGHESVGGELLKWRNTIGLNVDLPTSAEWEYACRAGTATAYNNGTNPESMGTKSSFTSANLDEVAWYDKNSPDKVAHEVGLKRANEWGLYDMHGNVGEIVLDWYTKNIPASPTWDPPGPYEGEIDSSLGSHNALYRGGRYDNTAGRCRSGSGESTAIGSGGSAKTIGYRLCLVLE